MSAVEAEALAEGAPEARTHGDLGVGEMGEKGATTKTMPKGPITLVDKATGEEVLQTLTP